MRLPARIEGAPTPFGIDAACPQVGRNGRIAGVAGTTAVGARTDGGREAPGPAAGAVEADPLRTGSARRDPPRPRACVPAASPPGDRSPAPPAATRPGPIARHPRGPIAHSGRAFADVPPPREAPGVDGSARPGPAAGGRPGPPGRRGGPRTPPSADPRAFASRRLVPLCPADVLPGSGAGARSRAARPGVAGGASGAGRPLALEPLRRVPGGGARPGARRAAPARAPWLFPGGRSSRARSAAASFRAPGPRDALGPRAGRRRGDPLAAAASHASPVPGIPRPQRAPVRPVDAGGGWRTAPRSAAPAPASAASAARPGSGHWSGCGRSSCPSGRRPARAGPSASAPARGIPRRRRPRGGLAGADRRQGGQVARAALHGAGDPADLVPGGLPESGPPDVSGGAGQGAAAGPGEVRDGVLCLWNVRVHRPYRAGVRNGRETAAAGRELVMERPAFGTVPALRRAADPWWASRASCAGPLDMARDPMGHPLSSGRSATWSKAPAHPDEWSPGRHGRRSRSTSWSAAPAEDGARPARAATAAASARAAGAGWVRGDGGDAEPWREDGAGAAGGNEALRAIGRLGPTTWRRCSGHHSRRRAGTRTTGTTLPGRKLAARDLDRRTAGLRARAAIPNRPAALGIPATQPVD